MRVSGRHYTVDKTVVKFKGHLSFCQYLPWSRAVCLQCVSKAVTLYCVCSVSVERLCYTACLQHVSGAVMWHCVFAACQWSGHVTLRVCNDQCVSGGHVTLRVAATLQTKMSVWDSHGVKWLWLFHTGNTRRWWSEWTLSHEDHSETVHKSIQENHWYKYGLPADGT